MDSAKVSHPSTFFSKPRVMITVNQQGCQRCSTLVSSNGIHENISMRMLQFLKGAYWNILCSSCVSELDILLENASQETQPLSKKILVKRVHYYIENGFWVFTSYYHILKGTCCQNRCRHCAYGYSKNLNKK
jgi:hypothetical protein